MLAKVLGNDRQVKTWEATLTYHDDTSPYAQQVGKREKHPDFPAISLRIPPSGKVEQGVDDA